MRRTCQPRSLVWSFLLVSMFWMPAILVERAPVRER
jgi:hypothetical protein